jgi:ribosomal-protein-alanine N-acetyltransferase
MDNITLRRVDPERDAEGIVDWRIMFGDEPIGSISITNIVRGRFQSANLGYSVDEAHQGKGIATQAVALAAECAFGELGLHRLEAGTLVDNAASQRVLEKNGFVRIGLSPRYLHLDGEWRDHILFAKTAD